MGEHDQAVLHDEDAHQSVTDDGRTLRPVREDEYEYAGGISEMPALVPPHDSRPAFLFRGKELIPETLHVHGAKLTPTEWEVQYSNLTGSGDKQSFTPVINDSYRIVGHLGWIVGSEIRVPKNTIADGSPTAVALEMARLAEWHRQRVWSHDHPSFNFPAQSVSGTKPPAPCWPANRSSGALKPNFSEAVLKSSRDGPGVDASDELRLRENINFYLAGGGKAIVGSDRVWDIQDHYVNYRDYPYDYWVIGIYRCLALVAPNGHLQEVLEVQKIHVESRAEKVDRIALEVLDIALTVWMIIDLATIPVALFSLAGRLVAKEVMVETVKVTVNQEAKAILDSTTQRVTRELLKPVTEEEFGRGARRGVSAIDRGRGARPFYSTPGNRVAAAGRGVAPSVASSNLNVAADTAGTGGITSIGGLRAADGSTRIVVEGNVRPSISRRGFETHLVSGTDVGLPTYQRLHLWGPRLGDEAAAGLWLGPGGINIGEQARVEKLLQDLAARATQRGGTVRLRITGATHPPGDLPAGLRAHDFLSEVTYEFSLEGPGIRPLSGRISISIGPPPRGSIQMLGSDAVDTMLEAL
jgi:hypothetical protein